MFRRASSGWKHAAGNDTASRFVSADWRQYACGVVFAALLLCLTVGAVACGSNHFSANSAASPDDDNDMTDDDGSPIDDDDDDDDDNLAWTPMVGSFSKLAAVSGSSASDVYAVGTGRNYQGNVVHYDGFSWLGMEGVPINGGLRSVWAVAPTIVYVAGTTDSILQLTVSVGLR